MKAGPLRHRVTIEALLVSIDDWSSSDTDHSSNEVPTGAQIETWQDAFSQMLSAEISPLSGRELIAAQAVQSKVSTRIRIRWRPGIVPSMRVRHRATVYAIEAVVPDPESGREWLTLLCTDGINQG